MAHATTPGITAIKARRIATSKLNHGAVGDDSVQSERQREVRDSQASLLPQRPGVHQVICAVDTWHQRRRVYHPASHGNAKRDHRREIAVSKLAHQPQSTFPNRRTAPSSTADAQPDSVEDVETLRISP
jgi:hypothetical protein